MSSEEKKKIKISVDNISTGQKGSIFFEEGQTFNDLVEKIQLEFGFDVSNEKNVVTNIEYCQLPLVDGVSFTTTQNYSNFDGDFLQFFL